MYETIPDQPQTKGKLNYNTVQTYDKAQPYERAQTCDHHGVQLIEQLLRGSTCEKSSGTELEEESTKI